MPVFRSCGSPGASPKTEQLECKECGPGGWLWLWGVTQGSRPAVWTPRRYYPLWGFQDFLGYVWLHHALGGHLAGWGDTPDGGMGWGSDNDAGFHKGNGSCTARQAWHARHSLWEKRARGQGHPCNWGHRTSGEPGIWGGPGHPWEAPEVLLVTREPAAAAFWAHPTGEQGPGSETRPVPSSACGLPAPSAHRATEREPCPCTGRPVRL